MMNPVTVELLNRAEKRNRAEQVRACQLRNQAHTVQSDRASPFVQVRNSLAALLADVGQRLLALGVALGAQVPGQAR